MRTLFASMAFGVTCLLGFNAAALADGDKPVCDRVADLAGHTVVEKCLVKQATSPAFKLALSGCDGALFVNAMPKGSSVPASIVCQGQVVGYVAAYGKFMYAETIDSKNNEDNDVPSDARVKAVFAGTFLSIVRPVGVSALR